MSVCQNCASAMDASYCPQCGQKNVDLDRPLWQLIGEVLRETFDVDGRAFKTQWTLFRHPGVLTSDFLAGHRRRYTPPFRLYLVLSLVFFLVAGWAAGRGILLTEDSPTALNASEQARFIGEDLPRLMFFLLPVFALILKLAYWQRRYFDHLIHSLHLHCAAYALLALILPLERIASTHWGLLVVQLVLFTYLVTYFAKSLKHVYQANWRPTILKTAGLFIAYAGLLGVLFDGASYLTR